MKTYFYKGSDHLYLNRYDNLVGRILLPKGTYTIQAKAEISSISSRWNYTEIFNAKLICGDQTDEALMSIFPRIDRILRYGESIYNTPTWVNKYEDQGGRETIVFLQLAVKIEKNTHVDFTFFNASSGEKPTQMLTGISILAREEDELIMLDTFQPDKKIDKDFRSKMVKVDPRIFDFIQQK